MEGERIAFIQKGVTTRAEIVETLGPPLHDLKPKRTIAYAWEVSGPTWNYSILGTTHEIFTPVDRWLFCVQFDENSIVNRQGKTIQRENESADDAVSKWLNENTY